MSSKRATKPTQKAMGKDPLAPLTEGVKKSDKSDKATAGEFIMFITLPILFS